MAGVMVLRPGRRPSSRDSSVMAPMREAELAAAGARVPAGEIRAMVEAARGIERRRHDRMRTADIDVAVADRGTRPDRQLRAIFGDRAVADEQAHEVTLVGAQVFRIDAPAQARRAAMILQQHA